jgi:hypothetical protein
MMKFLRRLLVLFLGIFIVGCTFPTSTKLPTVMPTEYIATAIALTVEARGVTLPIEQPESLSPSETTVAPTQISSATPLPSSVSSPMPTRTPPPDTLATASPTPDNATTPTPESELPYARIQILSPGPASRVVSPFLLRAFLAAGPTGKVQIELQGEDGRLLMREIKLIGVNEGAQINIALDMNFEITAAAEAGRIVVSIEDQYGRLISLASTDVILLSLGESDLNQPGDLREEIIIDEPKANALIQGGKVRVSGLARPRSTKPLVIELQTTDGRVAGIYHMVHLDEVMLGTHQPFSVDVLYSVESPTKVRLVVWERGERIPGIVHLSSVEVLLSP